MEKEYIFFVEGVDAKSIDIDFIQTDHRVDLKRLFELFERAHAYIYTQLQKNINLSTDDLEELETWTKKMLINDSIAQHILHHENFQVTSIVGYSIGYITSLYISRAITLETTIDLIALSFVLEEDPSVQYATIFEWGIEIQKIREHIENNFYEQLYIGADMGDQIGLVSGLRESACKYFQYIEEQGAISSSFIEVPMAFHTPFARKNIEVAKNYTKQINVRQPQLNIYSMYTGEVLNNSKQLIDEITKNMVERVPLRSFLQGFEKKQSFFVEPSLGNGFSKVCKGINHKIHFIGTKKKKVDI